MTIAGNTQMMHWNQRRSRLPEGYREVDYLESTGAQWIDTGVKADWTGLNVVLDMMLFQHSIQEVNYFGGDNSNAIWNFAGGFNDYNSFILQIEKPFVQYGVQDGNRHVHEYDNPNNRVGLDGNYTYWANWGRSVNTNFSVFQRVWYGVVQNPSHNRLWEAVFSVDGDKIRSYIPCVRTSDSKPGMYDLCGSICPLTGTPFYINAGAGADFLWGEL